MATPVRTDHGNTASRGWFALLLLAVLVYALGLDGQYIPSNGDEMVYAHIARLTAASQHWLPLVSELENMRNTKPPLLFWQAMVASNWGQNWQLWVLRAPSLLYTLLITAAIAATVRRLSNDNRSALVAACVYLSFFCTFRYGRPYLTSAAETFWLDLPMFWLLWQCVPVVGGDTARPVTALPNWGAGRFALCGLPLGVGAAYKSFALIAPAAATLWCALLVIQRPLRWPIVLRTTLGCALSAAIALALFSFWLVLDPDPQAVWREFVIGENAGKLAKAQGYWQTALHGGSSVWVQLLAYVQDAGLLAFVVLGLAWSGWQTWRRRGVMDRVPPHVQIMLIWLAVWLLIFTLPSQRSARYVIPAMPALAMLLALYWSRIARAWFMLTLLLAALVVLALGRIAWVAHELEISSPLQLGAAMVAVLIGAGAVLAGWSRPGLTRACAVLVCILVYLCFDLSVLPMNGTAGRFSQRAASDTVNATIAVPNGFNAQFERFQFLLPGNRFVPYDAGERARANAAAAAEQGAPSMESPEQQLRRLLASHDGVVWPQADAAQQTAPCLPDCVVLGSRWRLTSRHRSGEIRLSNIWYPEDWLFRREWLLRRASP
jgi:4-amino-4-deoxy-L-arabinose transferase-like glycosyltransferase